MGFLAYQFPNQELKLFKGKWGSGVVEELPTNAFFITDFTKDKMYYFIEEQEVEGFENEELTFEEDDSVFEVNGRFYINGLQFFVDGFEDHNIEKAIYSRIKKAPRENTNIQLVFNRLAKAYKSQALVYLASDEAFGTWMGATPEILLSGNEEKLKTMALAGTKSDESDNWTPKEDAEHQYVVDFIKEGIEKQKPSELKVMPVKTVKAGAVYHLQTDFEFKLPANKWNQLIQTLHPTPAVCGTPADLAKEYILKLEPHDRAFYTGIIGWRGEEELNVYVNLRCMQVLENTFALYLGGGITLDSDIGAEWRETELKGETLLSLLYEK